MRAAKAMNDMKAKRLWKLCSHEKGKGKREKEQPLRI
jgi:hypothetical protein